MLPPMTVRAVALGCLLAAAMGACGKRPGLKMDGGEQDGPSGSGGADGGGSGGQAGIGGRGAGGVGTGGDGTGGGTGRVPINHRSTAVPCPTDRPLGPDCPTPDGGVLVGTCVTDSECAAGANGRCLPAPRFRECTCSYDACFVDTDCATGGSCACRSGNGPNVCLAGNCRVDADCGAGGYCSPTLSFSCGRYGGIVGTYCHTPHDTCVDDTDCTAGECRYNPAVGFWACATSTCVG